MKGNDMLAGHFTVALSVPSAVKIKASFLSLIGPFRSNQTTFCVCLTPAERGAAPGQPFRTDA